jgi:hypothetical protein
MKLSYCSVLTRALGIALVCFALGISTSAQAALITLSDLSSDELGDMTPTPAEDLSATLLLNISGPDELTLSVTNDTTVPTAYDIDAVYFNALSNVTALTLESVGGTTCVAGDDRGQLDLVVELIGRDLRRNDVFVGTDDRAAGTQEEDGILGHARTHALHQLPHLLDVAVVVDGDADELPRPGDRGAKPDIGEGYALRDWDIAHEGAPPLRRQPCAEIRVGQIEQLERIVRGRASDPQIRDVVLHAGLP